MFGWEFPPHISGGLGTACFGLTKALTEFCDIELTFVVPKVWGDEHAQKMHLIGANAIQVVTKQLSFPDFDSKLSYYELKSGLIPYLGTSEYFALKSKMKAFDREFAEVDEDGKFNLSGGYGAHLFQEINYYAKAAETLSRELKFDLIHVHDWMTFPAGMAVKQASGKPLVVHIHSTEFDRSGQHVNPEICAIERAGLQSADRVIAVSNFISGTICRNYHIDPEKVRTVYNATETAQQINDKFKIAHSKKVVAFLGRITFQKGPEYFLEAAALLLQKTDDVRFIMAGHGDLRETMIQRAAELKIQDSIEFPGLISDDEVGGFFNSCDIFIMPSVSEPFGIVTLEAMQAGLPVIISKQSGVAEMVENALKVDYWDVQAIAKSIMMLLENKPFSENLASQGKLEAEHFKWTERAEMVLKTYHDLIG
jgi:glycosyltransferase involved in cell wall biosynthesis